MYEYKVHVRSTRYDVHIYMYIILGTIPMRSTPFQKIVWLICIQEDRISLKTTKRPNYFIKKEKLSKLSIVCTVGAVTFLTQYFYYILSPKSKWMIESNLNEDQTKAWLKIYKTNQWNYHFGLVLGIIGVMIFSNAFCH